MSIGRAMRNTAPPAPSSGRSGAPHERHARGRQRTSATRDSRPHHLGSRGFLSDHRVPKLVIGPAHFVIASYNVHGSVGSDGVRDPRRIAAVISELDANIVGLQEVESRVSAGERSDPLVDFARESGFIWTDGPTMQRPDSRFGNALLTRTPPVSVHRIDLSVPGREPRGAVDAMVDHESTRIRVVVAHLGLRPWERRAQCERLLSHLDPQDDCDVSVLLGDFNEWWASGRLLRRLHRAFGRTRGVRSFPARAPLFSLDRVWVKPARAVREIRAHRSALARRASDHLPVTARIDLSPRSAPTQTVAENEGQEAPCLGGGDTRRPNSAAVCLLRAGHATAPARTKCPVPGVRLHSIASPGRSPRCAPSP